MEPEEKIEFKTRLGENRCDPYDISTFQHKVKFKFLQEVCDSG